MDHPDQLELLHARPELIDNAVEEIIRYATPVLHMRRTATRATELAGVPIAEDDKVVIFYCSANFDEDEFTDPLRFDITRPVKPPQVSFGAKGPHHCLGAPLARMEIRVLLEEMIKQGTRFEQTGPIMRTNSNFVNGIAAMSASGGALGVIEEAKVLAAPDNFDPSITFGDALAAIGWGGLTAAAVRSKAWGTQPLSCSTRPATGPCSRTAATTRIWIAWRTSKKW